MVETQMQTRGTWQVAPSPFSIHYSRRILEEIRLAVVDAFFSLPRGGVEVGGVLLGNHRELEIEITDHLPLECEHSFGPSFTLSPRDQERLREILQATRRKPGGQEVVGWYHSHNRSEIFLSESDLEIQNRFFSEAWQVALVLRPHIFRPMRAGFFVRELGGSLRAATSYQEFVVEPFRGLPGNGATASSNPNAVVQKTEPMAAPALEESVVAPAAQPELPPITAPILPSAPPRHTEAPPDPLPSFLRVEAPKAHTKFWLAAVLVAGSVMGILGFVALGPQMLSRGAVSNAAGLANTRNAGWMNVIDSDGQLEIRWDTGSPAMEKAWSAVLLISDAGQERRIALDAAQLRAGSLTYTRRSERVDARLTINTVGGPFETATTFLGATPAALEAGAAAASAEAAALARQNDELREQNATLQSQIHAQAARVKTLEAQIEEMKKPPERKRAPDANRFFDPLE